MMPAGLAGCLLDTRAPAPPQVQEEEGACPVPHPAQALGDLAGRPTPRYSQLVHF